MKEYLVPRGTLTYADTLEAIGLASLLKELTVAEVRLRHTNEGYLVTGEDLPETHLWPPIEPGYPFIYEPIDGQVPPGWVVDYAQERAKDQRLREFRRATGKKREQMLQALREKGLEELPSPVPEYKIALFLASMRMGWKSDKQLYRWLQQDKHRAAAWVAGNMLATGEQVKDAPKVTNSQVFNPISGKGVHRPKPDSTFPQSISGELINPFREWLKFRGAYRAMLSYRVDDDFKVFVIEPADISLGGLTEVYNDLLGLSLWGRIYLDIETTLRLVELLIHRSDVMGNKILLAGRRPRDVIRGLHQAFFKSMGNAAALMNYSFTELPSWFSIDSREDANSYLALIHSFVGRKQRDGVVGSLLSLDENRSSDIPALLQFRKWLMTGALKDFLEFSCLFALHVMEKRGANEWVREMSTVNLNTLMIRGYGMQDIIESKGFQSLARAIRNATIYALADQKQGKRSREVHYGLAQKWKQKIKGGEGEFIAALSEFVQQYNWESEKFDAEREKGTEKWKYHKVNAADLDEVIGLVQAKGAELVGMLLLAYGYSRMPKAGQSDSEPEPATSMEEVQ
jgi:hypothetical protein